MGDLLQIFIILQSTKILIKWNLWLGMYVPYILTVNRRANEKSELIAWIVLQINYFKHASN